MVLVFANASVYFDLMALNINTGFSAPNRMLSNCCIPRAMLIMSTLTSGVLTLQPFSHGSKIVDAADGRDQMPARFKLLIG